MEVMWKLTDQDFFSSLNSHMKNHGYCISVGGSVMYQGYSYKDLDLVIIPLQKVSSQPDILEIREILTNFGLVLIKKWIDMQEHWRSKGSLDQKIVEVYSYNGKRIDCFYT